MLKTLGAIQTFEFNTTEDDIYDIGSSPPQQFESINCPQLESIVKKSKTNTFSIDDDMVIDNDDYDIPTQTPIKMETKNNQNIELEKEQLNIKTEQQQQSLIQEDKNEYLENFETIQENAINSNVDFFEIIDSSKLIVIDCF